MNRAPNGLKGRKKHLDRASKGIAYRTNLGWMKHDETNLLSLLYV